MEGWKSEFLSHDGKEVFIKAVDTNVLTYPTSCFHIPVTLCMAINYDIASFWWEDKKNSDKFYQQLWAKFCRAKYKSGLGFKDHETINIALLAKQCWRTQNNPNALWVKILKA